MLACSLADLARHDELYTDLFDGSVAADVEGVWTRDDTGKLLVVCALAQDGEKFVLRDAAGEIQWGELGRSLQPARELPARALLLGDGSQVAIRGWILDCTRGVVPYFCVKIGGVERALPWSAVAYEEEAGAWRVDLQAVGRLSNLRVVTADGRVSDPL